MKYAIEMGSGSMMNIPDLITVGSGLQKLMERDTQTGDLISILLFFQNKESRLKMETKHSHLSTLVVGKSPSKGGIQNKLPPVDMWQLAFCLKERKLMLKQFLNIKSNSQTFPCNLRLRYAKREGNGKREWWEMNFLYYYYLLIIRLYHL
jgi:hypothetical protein